MSRRIAFLIAVALVCLAGVLWVRPTLEQRGVAAEAGEGRYSSKVPRASIDPDRRETIRNRQIAGIDLETVLRLLSLEVSPDDESWDDQDSDWEDLLRRLGQLLGEEGMDQAVERYGTTGRGYRALGLVLEGWMSVDPDGATSALLSLEKKGSLEGVTIAPSNDDAVVWKGQKIAPTEWGIFSSIARWQFFGGAVREATRIDPERGLDLMEAAMLMPDFNSLFGDYVRALEKDSDWVAVHAELVELADRKEVPMPNGWDPIPVEIAHTWVASDLDGAMDWLLQQETRSGKGVTDRHLAEVLGRKTFDEGIAWLEANVEDAGLGDDLLVAYASHQIHSEDKAEVVARLAALGSGEEAREWIEGSIYVGSPMGLEPSDEVSFDYRFDVKGMYMPNGAERE